MRSLGTRPYNRPRMPVPPTTLGKAPSLGEHMISSVSMKAYDRGENLAKLIEGRKQFLTQQKAENMKDELERLASVPAGMRKFWGRANELRAQLIQGEMRDPRTVKDMDAVVARIRAQGGPVRGLDRGPPEPALVPAMRRLRPLRSLGGERP